MSFDGIFTHLMVQELQNELVNGRVNKIHQPYENEVIFVIRSQGKITNYCYSPIRAMLGFNVHKLPIPTQKHLQHF